MAKVVVVGGGAAGMMAAISAAKCGHKVSLFERNEKLGKKIYITGKGRCNVTNACEVEDIFANIVTNRKFMYSAIYSFDNSMVQMFFEENNCRLKVERGNRVFPCSDKSYDIINALDRAMQKEGVDVHLNSRVQNIIVDDGIVKGIEVNGKKIYSDVVIVATGGYSYPSTGSDGDGHSFARENGINHKIFLRGLEILNILKGKEKLFLNIEKINKAANSFSLYKPQIASQIQKFISSGEGEYNLLEILNKIFN